MPKIMIDRDEVISMINKTKDRVFECMSAAKEARVLIGIDDYGGLEYYYRRGAIEALDDAMIRILGQGWMGALERKTYDWKRILKDIKQIGSTDDDKGTILPSSRE